jgi:hypothetical protein
LEAAEVEDMIRHQQEEAERISAKIEAALRKAKGVDGRP